MKTVFDRYTICDFSDEAIILELCEKIRKLRRSCCISQTELAQKSGVSIASIKRIEAGTVTDLNICTLIKILRACGKLDGMAELIPDVPESPFLIDQKTGRSARIAVHRIKPLLLYDTQPYYRKCHAMGNLDRQALLGCR